MPARATLPSSGGWDIHLCIYQLTYISLIYLSNYVIDSKCKNVYTGAMGAFVGGTSERNFPSTLWYMVLIRFWDFFLLVSSYNCNMRIGWKWNFPELLSDVWCLVHVIWIRIWFAAFGCHLHCTVPVYVRSTHVHCTVSVNVKWTYTSPTLHITCLF